MCKTVYSTLLNKYELYEVQSHSRHNRRCIDNTITGCNKCVGYCQYSEHPGFLTDKLRKQHNCIEKQCFYYIAKPKKDKTEPELIDLSSSILSFANKVLNDNQCVRVIRVNHIENNRYTAFYVTITNECKFSECKALIEKEMKIDISFVKLNYDFDTCVSLLCIS